MKQEYGLKSSHRKKSRFPWLFPFAVCFWVIFCMGLVTQIVARELGYHPALGEPFFGQLYWPWKVFGWIDLVEGTRVSDIISTGFGFFIFSTLIAFFIVLRKDTKGNVNLHGTATWAKPAEFTKMGLNASTGVYVGGFKKGKSTKYLIHNGPEHVMAFAPTRSGKGVGLVVPSLLIWEGSSITLDVKGENYALTAGYREKVLGHKVLRFDPADETCSFAKFNPLAEVRLSTSNAVSDIQNIAQMICDPDGKGMKDYFVQAGYAFLTGLILHVVVVKENATLGDVVEEITKKENEGDVKGLLFSIVDTKHEDILLTRYPDMSKSLAVDIKRSIDSYAGEAVIKADRELSGVVSTAMTNLSLYRDPTVSKNTSHSDFKISEIMNSDRPVDLYIVIAPAHLDRLRPLIRIFFNLTLRKLTEKMEFKDGETVIGYKHRLLLMLDEFTSLGKLEIMEKSLAFMASYGIKAYIIVQDISQLYKAYTKDESIISNCHVRIAYAPNKIETAKLLSDMTGKTTVVEKKTTISGKRMGGMGNASISMSEVARPLLTPDECMRLKGSVKDSQGKVTDAGDMLIFVAGYNAIYGSQILFFKDPVLSERSNIEPP